ncbi:hypothetical protein [Rhodopirellula sp. MGV]|uniref:hypothetical protein n=1 Tax=Rhodopirellula sp. MGV TaxID=2023130 RepID=UPI00117A8CF4|nr:hypothetical protein [Rhodopirellula sp. MGV]
MKSFFRLALCALCFGSVFTVTGCSSGEATVIEPENDDQLEQMRKMVEAESQATDDSDANRAE